MLDDLPCSKMLHPDEVHDKIIDSAKMHFGYFWMFWGKAERDRFTP